MGYDADKDFSKRERSRSAAIWQYLEANLAPAVVCTFAMLFSPWLMCWIVRMVYVSHDGARPVLTLSEQPTARGGLRGGVGSMNPIHIILSG